MDSRNITALITGAARGMGKAFAEELADDVANIAICDINGELLQQTAAQLREEKKVQVIAGRVDVSNEGEVNKFVKIVEKELRGIDILINNAAIHPLHAIDEITSEEWDRVLAVN